MTYIEILKKFEEHLIENDKSKQTIEHYTRDIKQFLNWNENSIDNIDKILIKKYTSYP